MSPFVSSGSNHVYGIPQHATSMSLKTTTADTNADKPYYSEPYRLYTLDVFEYELDSAAALYGSIPVMLGHRKGSTAGVFWFNPTETFVDVEQGMTHAGMGVGYLLSGRGGYLLSGGGGVLIVRHGRSLYTRWVGFLGSRTWVSLEGNLVGEGRGGWGEGGWVFAFVEIWCCICCLLRVVVVLVGVLAAVVVCLLATDTERGPSKTTRSGGGRIWGDCYKCIIRSVLCTWYPATTYPPLHRFSRSWPDHSRRYYPSLFHPVIFVCHPPTLPPLCGWRWLATTL